MTQQQTYNVICIKWGTAYNAEYVNRLYRMIKRNTTKQFNFYCFTDDVEGLSSEIITQPMTSLNVKPEENKYAYRKEAGLCDNNLGGLNGQRVLYFDLDVVIVDNIDCFFEFPSGNEFVIINDWNTRGDHVGQASCYSWVVGELGFVKKYFEEHPREVVEKYFTASQEFLSDQVVEHYGKLNFWPESWCRSFRFHCLPKGVLRHFFTAKIPVGAKVLVFHGSPNPHEAIQGVWSTVVKIPAWKRLYKVVKPTRWIEDFWK
ncbi:hypothetical protein [Malonomonas rubra]|uniref:hypothetical protein n=1 Tax=Malonomonas rubra TaxID=57040 RepID=UPI0026F06B1C|nr:hypothetical protein [Malonomonas rubra]